MTFNLLQDKLREGFTLEGICKQLGFNLVECDGNEVYYDSNCEEFFEAIGVSVEDFGVGYAVLSTKAGKVYEIPYDERENRNGSDLENELILIVNHNEIYDVTELY